MICFIIQAMIGPKGFCLDFMCMQVEYLREMLKEIGEIQLAYYELMLDSQYTKDGLNQRLDIEPDFCYYFVMYAMWDSQLA